MVWTHIVKKNIIFRDRNQQPEEKLLNLRIFSCLNENSNMGMTDRNKMI